MSVREYGGFQDEGRQQLLPNVSPGGKLEYSMGYRHMVSEARSAASDGGRLPVLLTLTRALPINYVSFPHHAPPAVSLHVDALV